MHISKNFILKTLITLVAIAVILISGALFLIRDTTYGQCYLTGGWMVQRSNNCSADSCKKEKTAVTDSETGFVFNVGPMGCGQSFSMSCDCGSGKCWDGSGCVDDVE
jgi:hypothetical protein